MSGADQCHLPVLEVEDGIMAARVDSPVHIAGMAALVPLELVADNKVSVAGSRGTAGFVRCISASTVCLYPTSPPTLPGDFLM